MRVSRRSKRESKQSGEIGADEAMSERNQDRPKYRAVLFDFDGRHPGRQSSRTCDGAVPTRGAQSLSQLRRAARDATGSCVFADHTELPALLGLPALAEDVVLRQPV
jgi:hypothetical protein